MDMSTGQDQRTNFLRYTKRPALLHLGASYPIWLALFIAESTSCWHFSYLEGAALLIHVFAADVVLTLWFALLLQNGAACSDLRARRRS
ncbi:hypothetical protein K456DRAFT_712066 [Colletotrichum gloeosporioides 23]|nr:hypothetical protein K456DRAFT_712066 [Colletotrichum gloeosporioides 23]